jgi:MoaA/NifB/PqqE/SkfB family radical SAM enzyme
MIKELIPEKVSFFFLTCYLRITGKNLKRKKLLRFEVHLTDHCKLNCKHCDHFSPVAKEKYLNVDSFERDCARISELTGRQIDLLYLLGGEPLLHPQLTGIMDIAGRYFDTGVISIITNGILLFKQPEAFWLSCKRNRIQIIITIYPIKIDFEAIERLGQKYGVTVLRWDWGGKRKKLYRMPFDLEGKQPVKSNFRRCIRGNTCVFLQDGRLYTCSTIPCIQHLDSHFNLSLQVSENDSIDIHQAKTIDEVLDFLCKPAPFCRYCKVKNMVFGLDWDISKKEISEWI